MRDKESLTGPAQEQLRDNFVRASLQGGEMANRENTGKYGKSRNYIKMNGFLDFLRGLSWGLLNRLKMLPQDVGTFSTIGQPILRTFIFWSFLTLPPPDSWRNGEMANGVPLERRSDTLICHEEIESFCDPLR